MLTGRPSPHPFAFQQQSALLAGPQQISITEKHEH